MLRSRRHGPPFRRWSTVFWLGTTTSSRLTVLCQERTGKRWPPVLSGKEVVFGRPPKKWRTKRLCNTKWRVSPVNHEVAREGLRRTDGTWGGRSRPLRDRRKGRAGKTFHPSGVRVRRLGRTCRFGRAYSCAAQHLRRVVPDEGNRSVDESRQVDELLMDAVEPINPLEGVGETVSSP